MNFNDDEQIISRNFLMFMDTAKSDHNSDENNNNSSAGGENSKSNNGFGSSNESYDSIASIDSNSNFRPSDKLIIKAKIYILEILEVFKIRG
jgi:hypothetical protein